MNEKALTTLISSFFESQRIPYFITGSMASIAQGEPRFTNDIDVVADIPIEAVPALLAAFPSPEFYLSNEAVIDAINRRFQFNIIHVDSAFKIDVIIPERSPFNELRLQRAIRLNLDADHSARFATPEDVILKKLQYFQEGGSEKHLRDIAGLFTIKGSQIDLKYLEQWAKVLGVSAELNMVLTKIRLSS